MGLNKTLEEKIKHQESTMNDQEMSFNKKLKGYQRMIEELKSAENKTHKKCDNLQDALDQMRMDMERNNKDNASQARIIQELQHKAINMSDTKI